MHSGTVRTSKTPSLPISELVDGDGQVPGLFFGASVIVSRIFWKKVDVVKNIASPVGESSSDVEADVHQFAAVERLTVALLYDENLVLQQLRREEGVHVA